jgi:Tfp pilus assembly protein PilN
MKLTMSTILRGAFTFLNWWFQELSGALEDLRSRLAPRWRRSLTVFVTRSRLQIIDADDATDAPIVDVLRSDLTLDLTSSIAEEQRPLLAAGRRVRLVLDPDLAFVQRMRMPLATLPHLASAIELQMPKLFPVSVASLKSDFEIREIDSQNASVDLDLAAIKLSDTEPIETVVESLGLHIVSIHLGSASEPRVRFKFGASDTRVNRFAITRADTLLTLSAAALAICLVAVFFVQAFRAHRSLEQALAHTNAAAATVLQQRQQLISRLETLSQVSKAERTTSAAVILSDLTRRMDQSAWLTTFELKGHKLRLVGFSPEPATAVKELAGSGLISDVELHSSASAATNSGKDRFEITARVKGGS